MIRLTGNKQTGRKRPNWRHWSVWGSGFIVLLIVGSILVAEGQNREFTAGLARHACVGTEEEKAVKGCSYSGIYRAVHGIEAPPEPHSAFSTAGTVVMALAWIVLVVGVVVTVAPWLKARVRPTAVAAPKLSHGDLSGNSPPAGWITDPDDPTIMRWWDGQALTIFTRPRD